MQRSPGSTRLVVALFLTTATLSALVVGSVATTAVAQGQQPTGDEILDRVEQRYEDADTVAGRAVVTTSNASVTATANLSFAYASPDSYRFVLERDDETVRFGTNGSVAWAVGLRGTAVWSAGGPNRFGRASFPGSEAALKWLVPTGDVTEDVSARLVGTTTVDGVPAYELELRPTDGDDGATTTLWVARDDARVLGTATTDGANRTVVDVTETYFDVSIDESTFQPPDDRLAAWSFDRYDSFASAQNATALDLPRLDGGTFTEATVTVQQGETVVAQRYDLDGENVTVVSTTSDDFGGGPENATTVRIDGRNATVTAFGDRSAVVWTDGNVTTAVLVEGSTDRAVEVAGRVT